MDEETPLVSVIMSVYNGSAWLRLSMDSILNQTYQNFEFIIIDDHSDLETKIILDSYKSNPKVKVFHREKSYGLTRNLNYALSLCQGSLIARMDGDDISLKQRFEIEVDYLLKHPDTDVVSTYIMMMDEQGDDIGPWSDDQQTVTSHKIKKMMPWKCCLAHPTVMIRTVVLQYFKYNEKQIHSQDWDLWLRMCAAGKIIEKIPEVHLLYRVHKQSVTATSNLKSAFLKKQETYRTYFKDAKLNQFNQIVWLAYTMNRIKLALSKLKRSLRA